MGHWDAGFLLSINLGLEYSHAVLKVFSGFLMKTGVLKVSQVSPNVPLLFQAFSGFFKLFQVFYLKKHCFLGLTGGIRGIMFVNGCHYA